MWARFSFVIVLWFSLYILLSVCVFLCLSVYFWLVCVFVCNFYGQCCLKQTINQIKIQLGEVNQVDLLLVLLIHQTLQSVAASIAITKQFQWCTIMTCITQRNYAQDMHLNETLRKWAWECRYSLYGGPKHCKRICCYILLLPSWRMNTIIQRVVFDEILWVLGIAAGWKHSINITI